MEDIDDVFAKSSEAEIPRPDDPSSPGMISAIGRLSRMRRTRRSTTSSIHDHRRSQLHRESSADSTGYNSLVAAYIDSNIPSSPAGVEYRKMEPVVDSMADFHYECVHSKVITASDSVNCGLCQNTVKELFDNRREKLLLLDRIDSAQKDIQEEKNKLYRQIRSNQKLTLRTKELEDALDLQADEIMVLKKDMEVVTARLAKEAEERADIQAERDRMKSELEDVSKSLFEEANTMVFQARKEAHATQMQKTELEQELHKVKGKIKSEKMQNLTLRRKLSHVGTESIRRKSADLTSSMKELQVSGVESATPHDLDVGKVPHTDEFASLDVDSLPDQRLFIDFTEFLSRLHPAINIHKLSAISQFYKSCMDDHVEPCARLGKISSRRIIDAVVNNLFTLEIADTASVQSPQSSPVSKASEVVNGNKSNSPVLSIKSLASTPEMARSASPVKLWNSLTNPTIVSSPTICGGCGREGTCKFRLTLLAETGAPALKRDGSSSDTKVWIDSWCRDRIYSIWEFYRMLRKLIALRTDSDTENDGIMAEAQAKLFVEYLRSCKVLFYARVGVMSYFRTVEAGIDDLQLPSPVLPPDSPDALAE
eukprot:Partr_v1_DN28203_c1_g1_i2_m75230